MTMDVQVRDECLKKAVKYLKAAAAINDILESPSSVIGEALRLLGGPTFVKSPADFYVADQNVEKTQKTKKTKKTRKTRKIETPPVPRAEKVSKTSIKKTKEKASSSERVRLEDLMPVLQDILSTQASPDAGMSVQELTAEAAKRNAIPQISAGYVSRIRSILTEAQWASKQENVTGKTVLWYGTPHISEAPPSYPPLSRSSKTSKVF